MCYMEAKFQALHDDLYFICSNNNIQSFKLGLTAKKRLFHTVSKEKLSFDLVSSMMRRLGHISKDEEILNEIENQIAIYLENLEKANDPNKHIDFLKRMSEVLNGKVSFHTKLEMIVRTDELDIPVSNGLEIFELPPDSDEELVSLSLRVYYSVKNDQIPKA